MRFREAVAVLFLITVPITAEATGEIANIQEFLEICPQNDPAFSQIQLDFEIRRDGAIAPTPFCSEPVSQMSTAAYTDELIVLQGLRTMYYMDRGMSGHLPWTSGTLYDWFVSKIDGINIATGVSGGFCCTTYGNKLFFTAGAQNDFNRDFDKKWIGIAGNIAFYAHEVRHVDGFPHSSCCGITNGCDATFDESNLAGYAVSWWLNKLWLYGTINVGYTCMSAADRDEATYWFSGAMNSLRDRFCSNKPALVSASPPGAGGNCVRTVADLVAAGSSGQVALTWTAAINATHYEVERRVDGGAYSPLATPASNAYTDNTVADQVYRYRVRGLDDAAHIGDWSNVDLALATTYGDDPIVAQQTVIQQAHVTQLRDAVARLRQAGGLTSFTFTDPSPAVVRAVHMTELRTALNEALTALGIPLPNLGTAPASGNVIMATHVQELRAATR